MIFKNKIAFITGASRGIGKSIAKTLFKKGAKVFGTATNEKNVNKINSYLNFQGKGILMNFSDLNSINTSIKDKENFSILKNIDILINNAAINEDHLLIRTKNESWQKTIDVNLTAIFLLTRLVIKNMIKKRFGRIINIGSIIGSIGNTGQVSYATTKAGLVGFSKSLSREVSSRGITVNVVSPGFIETDMTKKLSIEKCNKILEKIPLSRFGKTQEIANVVAFLASDEASYITGQTINVNGGMYMS